MRFFLGTNVDDKGKDLHYDGESFIVAQPTPEQKAELDAASREVTEQWKRRLGLGFNPLTLLLGISFFAAVCLTSGILSALLKNDVPIAQAYANAPLFFWLTPVAWIVFILAGSLQRKKAKSATETTEDDPLMRRLETVKSNIMAELGIMSDTPEVELISVSYKWKDGEYVPTSAFSGMSPYDNMPLYAFRRDDMLCFADTEGVYGFPITSLCCIRTVKEKIALPVWIKEISHDDEQYAAYMIEKTREDDFVPAWYHILEVERDGERWGILFPNYELPLMQQLTGLSPEED